MTADASPAAARGAARTRRSSAAACVGSLAALASDHGGDADRPRRSAADRRRARPSRAATAPSTTTRRNAFAQVMPALTARAAARLRGRQQLLQRQLGDGAGVDRRAATASARLFNAQSCSSCHFQDGRAQPPADADDPERGPAAAASASPGAGRHARAATRPTAASSRTAPSTACPPRAPIRITTTEMPGTYADGTPYTLRRARPTRIADPAYGPLARRPHDLAPRRAAGVRRRPARGDPRGDDRGRGRPRRRRRRRHLGSARTTCRTPRTRRHRARPLRLEGQRRRPSSSRPPAPSSATSASRPPLCPTQDCTAGRRPSAWPRPTAATPEVDDAKLDQVDLLHPDARRARPPRRRRARRPPRASSCSPSSAARPATRPSCTTGAVRHRGRSTDQTIRPYTDLLLHDMGAGLADGRPDVEATGTRVAHRRRCGASA